MYYLLATSYTSDERCSRSQAIAWQCPHREVLPQLRPDFGTVHPIVPPPVLIEGPVVIHDVDDGQPTPAPDLKIVRVMTGRHLQGTRPELPIHVRVSNDGYCPAEGVYYIRLVVKQHR